MLNLRFIRDNPDTVKESLSKKGVDFNLDDFLELDSQRRRLQSRIQQYKAEQNKISKEIPLIAKEKKDPTSKIQESKQIKKKISKLEAEFLKLDEHFKQKIDWIPNLVDPEVPVGDVSCNKIVRSVGQLRDFSFKPRAHIELAQQLGIIHFDQGAKITGSNFVVFSGAGARLKRALVNFMLDVHIKKHGYQEVSVPKLVNRDSMRATGQLPKLEADMYSLKEEDFFLIPTAEVPVTNLYRNQVVPEADLPIKNVACTPCFRREAGSYGKDTQGLIRVHEFDKVEMVNLTKPENSQQQLEQLLQEACSILDLLNLPYRVVLLASQDLSFAAYKCYDIELYSPGVDKWLEVSSCSNFCDFQARRGNMRYRSQEDNKLSYLHTLNGSGVALARLLVAILENYQEEDGTIVIPEALIPYCDGQREIKN
jgi:seryl-tRNA synthetase